MPGRGVGFGLHAADELLHADAEADIELAGFFENHLAVIVGVELLLANLEDAGFAFTERQQLQRRGSYRRVVGILGQQIEVRFDTLLGDLEFLLDRFEGVAAVGRERGGHLEGHQVAAGNDGAELVNLLCGLRGLIQRGIGGAQGSADPGLGVGYRGAGDGDEGGLRVAQRIIQLFMLGCRCEPFASRGTQTIDGVVDVLDGFAEGGDDRLVGAEFNDLAELLSVTSWVSFIFFARSFSTSSLWEASSAGP